MAADKPLAPNPRLADKVQEHLYKMLTNNLIWEYNDQIEKWKLHIDYLTDAQQKAATSQAETLKAAGAQLQAELEESLARTMFILDLITAPALSWIGASIEHKWLSKFTNVSTTYKTVKMAQITNNLGSYKVFFPVNVGSVIERSNELRNAAVGELGEGAATFLRDLGVKAYATPKAAPLDTKFAENSADFASYRTGLIQTLYNQQKVGERILRDAANKVDQDDDLGQRVLDELVKAQPALQSADESKLKGDAIALINRRLNEARATWASKWFYFGNDPPTVNSHDPRWVTAFQREIWAVWVLQQRLDLVATYTNESGTQFAPMRTTYSINSDLLGTDAVLNELNDMDAPVMALLGLSGYSGVSRDGSTIKNRDDRSALDAAISRLNNWAVNHPVKLKALDYGKPRPAPLISIENYTGSAYGEYKSQ